MIRRSIALAASLILIGALAACGTATPYQPMLKHSAVAGGYSDIQIEPGRFRVSFSGNTLTSRETVETYLLYRAAELTVEAGFDHFTLVNRATDKTSMARIQPVLPYYTYGMGYWSPSWHYYGSRYGWRTLDPWQTGPVFDNSLDVTSVEKFTATAEILVGKGPKAADDPAEFDARAVLEKVGPKLQRPVDGKVR